MDILIVGMGKLGYKTAETLAGPEHNITVVDVDEQALTRAANRLDVLPVAGNGAAPALGRAGYQQKGPGDRGYQQR